MSLAQIHIKYEKFSAQITRWPYQFFAFWGMGSVIGSIVMAVAVRYKPPYQRGFAAAIFILILNIILLLSAKKGWKKQRELLSKEVLKFHSVTEEEKM